MSTVTHRPRPQDGVRDTAMPPGPRGTEVARLLLRLRRDPLRPLENLVDTYGDIVRFDITGRAFFVARGPEYAEQLLVSHASNYRKSIQYRLLAMALGEGLLTNEGESWKRQRRLVQPMFAKRHLSRFADHMTAAATDTLQQWDSWPDGHRLDVSTAMNTLTLDVVGRALFGVDLTDDAPRIGSALTEILRVAVAAAVSPLTLLPARLPGISVDRALRLQRPRWRRMDTAVGQLDNVVHRLIDERTVTTRAGENSQPDEAGDLLGLLLATRDENGEPMSRRQIRDEVQTFLLAGHETTANALAWTWYLLSKNPQVRERLTAEVDTVLGDRTPTADDADNLPYTTAVVQEAMRLYPPAWVIERDSITDEEIGGYPVPRDSTVIVAPYLSHRDPKVWDNPEGFDPRRFLSDQATGRPRGAYLPFGGGRRICVGAGFAQMEATLLLAMIAQRFTLDLVPGARVTPEATVTLRPRNGLPMILRRRTS